MPKRRLSYGEVVVDQNTSLPSAARRGNRPAGRAAPGTSRSVSRQKSSDVLIKLSQSCNNHLSNCHKDRRVTGNTEEEEEENIPEQCKMDLEKLRNLLPEIEKKFHPNGHGEKGPEAQDVAHLCDFYNSVMQGNYCPYAPHLFHMGKSPSDVLGRVIFLFRHIVSPVVITTVETGDVSKVESHESVICTITQTISHFLSFLSNISIFPKIFEDLVNLLHDCLFLRDANILPVQLSLFEGTLNATSANIDATVEIDRLDQLLILHMATIMVLSSFMMDQKQKKLQPHSNAALGAGDHSRDYAPNGWVDLHLSIPDRGLRNQFLATIATSLKSFLLLEHTLPISENLLSHGQVVGTKLLKRLLTDWTILSHSPSMVGDYSLLVVQAIEKSMVSSFPRPAEYTSALRDLLQRVVLDPACVVGQPFVPRMGKLFLLAILSCVDAINRKPVSTRDSLDAMVLMSIHFLLEDDESNAYMGTLCLSNGFITPLFDLLHDGRFANHVSAILVSLLWQMSTPQEINARCHAFLKDQQNETRGKEPLLANESADRIVDASSPMTRNETPRLDSSRKRRKPADKLGSPIRALTLASSVKPGIPSAKENSGKMSTSKGWTRAFLDTLDSSLRAAQRITQHCGEASSSETSSRSGKSILMDAHAVAITLRLICRMVSRCADDEVEQASLSSLLDVSRLYAEALMAACGKLSSRGVEDMGLSGDAFPQIIVDCALDLHYSVGQLMSTHQHPCFKVITELIRSSSFLSRKWLCDGEFCDAPSAHSFQGSEFPAATTIIESLLPQFPQSQDSSFGAFSKWRTTLIAKLGSLYTKRDCSSFIPTASFEILQAFPLGVRCCWLVSLYPTGNVLEDDIYIFGSLRSSPSSDLNNNTSNSSVVTLILLFLPLYTSSLLAMAPSETSTSLKTLLKIIVEFVIPVARQVEPSNHMLCRILLRTVSWLDTFLSLPIEIQELSCSRFDVFKEIQGLAGMNIQPFLGNFQQSSDAEVDMHLKECIHRLLSKIPENHSDHAVRKLRWLCMAKFAHRCSTSELRKYASLQSDFRADSPIRRVTTDEFRSQSCFMWLLESCFVDKNHEFRQEACQALCCLVLGSNNSYLLAHFASEEDCQTLATSSRVMTVDEAPLHVTYEMEHAAESVASELFRAVDRLLHASIGVCDSQLSFTMANSSSTESTRKGHGSQDERIFLKRSALSFFSWFCRHANPRSPLGRVCFEKAFQRIVRNWAATSYDRDGDFSFSTSRALAFGELSRRCGQTTKTQPVWGNDSPEFTAMLFSDVLVLCSSSNKQRQFFRLESFIRATMPSDLKEVLTNHRLLKTCQSLVEEFMPSIVAQFVEERSLDLLRVAPAFRQFLNERLRRARKQSTSELVLVGGSNASDRYKYRSTTISLNDLDNEAKKLCLDNKILERVFPSLMMGMDRTALSFFTMEVLRGMTLRTLIQSRETTILKGLIWELGQESETSGAARSAIIATAAARNMEDNVSDAEPHRSLAADVELGKKWVTNNFMYLLVSVVQFKWKTRPVREKLRAIRSLHGMLDFLAASESPQYFPQIMATINAGISDSCCDDWMSNQERLDARTLEVFAVKALSKIVRLVAEVQVETIALNLTTIVVALIPVVDDDSQAFQPRGDCSEARAVAVSILTFLTAGDLGRILASHFNEIPFLPTSKFLDKVHQSLHANGVDFDNLRVLSSTSQSQHGLTSTANAHDTTQASTIAGYSGLNDNDKMIALQKRLTLICGLLENESRSVRMVSLGHLTDLLRGNRDTFSKLITAEGSLAGKRFLTLTYKDDAGNAKWSSRGATASMLEKLVSRCIVESETEVRVRLAACLGEVGAISETILGELKISGSTGEEALDSPTSSFKWRLEQPPWQSQPVKYGLQLVTRHLAVALKAAASTTDQHKIAFAIQQLLHLLNSCGGENGQASSDSKDNKGKMTKWLKENLEQSGQYELVEPYFSSDFKEKSSESNATKRPPLFKVSACYFTWMSSFCRWMIQGSKSSELSPKGWRDLFFACRTAIRTESGLIVAEFIVPLLVLDRICFGTSEERVLLHRELDEIFQTTTKVFMPHSDRQKAVNMAFMIIDTLRIWSEREVEERSRGRSPTATSSRSRRQMADKYVVSSPTQCWPAEDSIARITELLNSIPLKLQAEAAEAYGMNALALQRLEIEARHYNALEIFEKTVEEQKKDSRGGKASLCRTFAIPAANDYNIELLKKVLSRLDDCETMAAIGEEAFYFDPMKQIRDSIRKQLSLDNYESALEEFERAFQASITHDRDGDLIRGFLRCLMELGRYESVLNHVGGFEWNKKRRDKHESIQDTVSYAVEATWKLGNWTKLSELLADDYNGSTLSSSQASQIAIGKAIAAFRQRDMSVFESAVRFARETIMQNLSNVAREGYEKSYDDIVTLQAVRELENAKEILILDFADRKRDLDEIAYSTSMDGWSWKGRVDVVTCRGALAIGNPRIALARLDSNPMLEASLFVESGVRARKNHRLTMAETLLLQAQAALAPLRVHKAAYHPKLVQLAYSLQVQQAKVKFSSGDCGLALKILGQRTVDHSVEEMLTKLDDMSVLEALAANCEKKLVLEWSGLAESSNDDGSDVVNRFSSRLLQLTRWSYELGLKGTSEILDRFRLIQKLAPGWEKGHFYFGRFVDNVLQARMTAMVNGVSGRESLNGVDENEIRGEVILRDAICQTHTLLAMRMYAAALKIDTKHVFQALPRLLSLWFDLVSVAREQVPGESGSKQDPLQMLRHHQNEANTFMATQVRDIPPIAFIRRCHS